jgi:hypothetical protein
LTRHYYLEALETDADRAEFAACNASFHVE